MLMDERLTREVTGEKVDRERSGGCHVRQREREKKGVDDGKALNKGHLSDYYAYP